MKRDRLHRFFFVDMAQTNQFNHHRLEIAGDYRRLFHLQGLDTLEALFQADLGEALSKPGLDGWRERRRLILDDHGQKRVFYIKRFQRPPSRNRRAVGSIAGARSVAGVEWLWLHQCRKQGIPVSVPVMVGEEFHKKKEFRSVVVMESVPGRSLEHWAAAWSAVERGQLKRLLRATAGLVRRFHQCGFFHRDLYLSHLFYDPNAGESAEIHLIDLQRVIRPYWFQRRWRVKDLAALNYSTPKRLVSTGQRLWWLKWYLNKPSLGKKEKALIRSIVKKSQRMERHDPRRQTKMELMTK